MKHLIIISILLAIIMVLTIGIIFCIVKCNNSNLFSKLPKTSERLGACQDIINKINNNLFSQLPKTEEIAERLSIYNRLTKNDVVLEFGGNIGGVSSLIATIINPKNLVVIEPNEQAVKKLKHLNLSINIFEGVIYDGKNKINCYPGNNFYSNCKIDTNITDTVNKTFEELEQIYDLKFNTLVIDCEGCYEYLFKYLVDKNLLINIDKIFIEWDGEFLESFLEDNNFVLVDYIPHILLPNGVRTYFNKRMLSALQKDNKYLGSL